MNLGREYDKLTAINKQLQEDNKQIRLEMADKLTVEKKMQEQLVLMTSLFAEIESLRSRMETV